MSSTLITNKTNLLAFKDMLKQISLDEKSIIIVPDKFSLNAEKMFFEEKNVLATFSTQVFSITKLASKVLEKELKNKKLIDKNVSLMIVSNIISENLHNFKYFKNIKDINKISEDIFNVISQMLSSQVCDFSEELCGNLKVKFEDLRLIFNLYKQKREEFLVDASKKYDLFLGAIENSDFIKQHNFYFGMFNSLTTQVKDIIKKIAKTCKKACFSCGRSENRVNNNEIYDFFSTLKPEIFVGTEKPSETTKFIEENFFSTKTDKMEVGFTKAVKLFEANTIDDEIDNLVFNIKQDVFLNKCRFKDISVCLANFGAYKDKVIEKFNENSISSFVDSDIKLIENSYAKYVLSFVSLLNDFNNAKFISFVKNFYLKIDDNIKNNFEKFLQKYSLENKNLLSDYACFNKDSLYKDYLFVYQNIYKKIENFKKTLKNVEIFEFFNNFNSILKDFGTNERLKEKIDYYLNTDILKYKQFLQVENKVLEAENCICEFYKQEFNIKKIENFLKICFENITISVPATSVDAVFVGDYLNSYFIECKKLYVLGADSGNFPSLKQDVSLFTDAELEKLEKNTKIEPKLKDTNRITYFKAFNCLLCFKNEICLSYSLTSEKGSRQFASNIYKNFLNRFTVFGENLTPLKASSEVLDSFKDAEILNLISLKYNTKSDFIKRYFEINNNTREKYLLYYILTNYYKVDENNLKINKNSENLQKIDKIDESLIKIDKFSSTSLENYFACPNKFLFKNLIKLNKFEPIKLDARVFGNIVHSCCYAFAQEIFKQIRENKFINIKDIETGENENNKELEENINEQNANQTLNVDFSKINYDKILESVFNSEKYKDYKNLENSKEILQNLKIEIKKLFVFIENQQKNSNFILSKAEFKFEKILDGIKFEGFIDRIDESENEFIIIDYKTGSTKISYAEIVFGKKIQLILYAKILETILNKKCAGIYYLSVNDDFSTDNKLKIYLNGITKNANNTVFRLDNSMFYEKNSIQSNYFEFSDKFVLSKTQFENLLDKTYEKVINAIKQIENGKFGAMPLNLDNKSSCEYCDYKEICNLKAENKVELDDNLLNEFLEKSEVKSETENKSS